MTKDELSKLSDSELLAEAKKLKSNAVVNATLIGVMIGIVIYSAVKNTLGFFTLIPLFLAFKVFHKPKEREALDSVLKERNLK